MPRISKTRKINKRSRMLRGGANEEEKAAELLNEETAQTEETPVEPPKATKTELNTADADIKEAEALAAQNTEGAPLAEEDTDVETEDEDTDVETEDEDTDVETEDEEEEEEDEEDVKDTNRCHSEVVFSDATW